MAYELVYTSSERGLKQGSRGFCTVACTRRVSAPMATLLESLSGYRHLFKAGGTGANRNPVVWSHLLVHHGGLNYHLLSRIADAGLDYSQRTNKIAHHLILGNEDLAVAGPGELLAVPGQFCESWSGEPRLYDHPRPIQTGPVPSLGTTWEKSMGDAGWKGVLAASLQLRRPVCLAFSPQQDVLSLFREVLNELPPEQQWQATFTTWYTKLPPGIDCLWKGALAGSVEEAQLRAIPQTIYINLTKPQTVPGSLENDPVFSDAIYKARYGVAKNENNTNNLNNTTPAKENTHINLVAVPTDDIFMSDDSIPRSKSNTTGDDPFIRSINSVPQGNQTNSERNNNQDVFTQLTNVAAYHDLNKTKSRFSPLVLTLLIIAILLGIAPCVLTFIFMQKSPTTSNVPEKVINTTDNTKAKVAKTPAVEKTKAEKKKPTERARSVVAEPIVTESEAAPEATPDATNVPANIPAENVPETGTTDTETKPDGLQENLLVNKKQFLKDAKTVLDTMSQMRLAIQKQEKKNDDPAIIENPKIAQACCHVLDYCQKNDITLQLAMNPFFTMRNWQIDGLESPKKPVMDKDENNNVIGWRWSFFWEKPLSKEEKEYLTVTLTRKGITAVQKKEIEDKEDKSAKYFMNEANLYLISILNASFEDIMGNKITDNMNVPLEIKFPILKPKPAHGKLLFYPQPTVAMQSVHEYFKEFFYTRTNGRVTPTCMNVSFPEKKETGSTPTVNPDNESSHSPVSLDSLLEVEVMNEGLPPDFSIQKDEKNKTWTLNLQLDSEGTAYPLATLTFYSANELKQTEDPKKMGQSFYFTWKEEKNITSLVELCCQEKRNRDGNIDPKNKTAYERDFAAYKKILEGKCANLVKDYITDAANKATKKIEVNWRVWFKNPSGSGTPILLFDSTLPNETGDTE